MEFIFKVEEISNGKVKLIDEFVFDADDNQFRFVKEQLRLISLLKKQPHFIEIKAVDSKAIIERNLNRCLKNLSDLENISGMDILSRYSKKVFNEDVGRIDFSILNDSRFLLSEIIKKMKAENSPVTTRSVVKKVLENNKNKSR